MYEKYGEDPRESYKMLFILASRHICIINIKMLEQAMVYKCDYLKLFKRKIHDIDKSVFKGMHTACGFELKEQDVIFRIHSRYKKCVILLRDLTIKKKLPMFYCNVVEIKGTRASVRLNKETIKEFKKRDILEKFLKFIHYTPLQEIPMILKFSKLTVVDKDKLHDVVVRDMEIEAFEKKVQIDFYTQEFCKLYKEILFYFFFVKSTRIYYLFI